MRILFRLINLLFIVIHCCASLIFILTYLFNRLRSSLRSMFEILFSALSSFLIQSTRIIILTLLWNIFHIIFFIVIVSWCWLITGLYLFLCIFTLIFIWTRWLLFCNTTGSTRAKGRIPYSLRWSFIYLFIFIIL